MFIFKVGRWVAYAWNPESSTPALGLKGFLLPLPHSVFFFFFQIYFAQAGIGDGQKGAVGTECHPEGKMKDKRGTHACFCSGCGGDGGRSSRI